jgi:hypothetical protein
VEKLLEGGDFHARQTAKSCTIQRMAVDSADVGAPTAIVHPCTRASRRSARGKEHEMGSQNTQEPTGALNHSIKQAAEEQRQVSEEQRASAEMLRAHAEIVRQSAESTREIAEAGRAAQEQTRLLDERERGLREDERGTAEQLRAIAEGLRETAEAVRQAAEHTRAAAEIARATQEGLKDLLGELLAEIRRRDTQIT